ncbi:uncharacterized protein LOC107227447 isoform X1 [Neodiprion lecontei]|uniref:Uncharacterized protein LOC107227447 isoform X1 n=2 Tax=Neodiprion lecontei TaxID=441921 RepID=A0ABM3G2X9_NEOLC|nr:uncharacterized protein LOC107227447 isoform X1 [Neodiprion lecontei]
MKHLTMEMVTVILLSATIAVDAGTRPSFVSDDMIAKASSVVNACQTQTGVTTIWNPRTIYLGFSSCVDVLTAHTCRIIDGSIGYTDIEAVRNGQWLEGRPLMCYMYCLWEQFGLVDDKRELSLNGMLTFFQRMPAYRAEVQRAIRECKRIGKYFAGGDNCQYAYTFNKCYAERSPRTYYLF